MCEDYATQRRHLREDTAYVYRYTDAEPGNSQLEKHKKVVQDVVRDVGQSICDTLCPGGAVGVLDPLPQQHSDNVPI